jgi:hypothetical protein
MASRLKTNSARTSQRSTAQPMTAGMLAFVVEVRSYMYAPTTCISKLRQNLAPQ